jgi:ferredoxin-NADP reductase
VVDLVAETARAKSIVLDLPGWSGHRAGQHVDIRLTAEDGYQAQRSYSIASAPEDDLLTLTIERLDDAIYGEELLGLAAHDELEVQIALTRAWPAGWSGHRGRIDRGLLGAVAWPPQERPRTYVCGPTAFVEAAAKSLVQSGHRPDNIKTERFGPTGG